MTATTANPGAPPRISRWPTEIPLRVVIVLVSIGIWGLLTLSIIGLIYGLMIGAFLFFAHVAFVAHVRGNGVRLGPDQFPELWERIVALSQRAGMSEPPAVYLMQAGGELNAFATKFFGGRLMVLYTELLEACGHDDAARDMVIGHELGHLAMRHLDWYLLTAPGRFVPFLGSAYSRACEHSCDRWGAALCGDPDGALRGLAILAAGPRHAGRVNLPAFVAQRADLDTGWMTIGSWLSGYPPLSARIEALQPETGRHVPHSTRGATRAVFLLAVLVTVPAVLAVGAASLWATLIATQLAAQRAVSTDAPDAVLAMDPAARILADAQVAQDLESLGALTRSRHAATGEWIEDSDALRRAWERDDPDSAFPLDPFDGAPYGVDVGDDAIEIYSSGGNSITIDIAPPPIP